MNRTTLAVPLSVRVTIWVALLPTMMLPKLTLVGLTPSWDEDGKMAWASFDQALSTPLELTAVATQ